MIRKTGIDLKICHILQLLEYVMVSTLDNSEYLIMLEPATTTAIIVMLLQAGMVPFTSLSKRLC